MKTVFPTLEVKVGPEIKPRDGITLLDLFAGFAVVGLLAADKNASANPATLSLTAKTVAKALITELEKP